MYNFLHVHNRTETLNQFTPSHREVVVLIRDLARSHRSWLGLHHALSEQFDVICLDLPGVGLAQSEKPLYRVGQMADRLAEVLQTLKLPRIYLVAPSLGGAVALELCLRLPLEVVRGLVLMAPSHSGLGLRKVTRQGLRTLQRAFQSSPEAVVEASENLLLGRLHDGRTLQETEPERLRAWRESVRQDSVELGVKGQFAQMMAGITYTSRTALNYVREYQIPLKCLIPTQDALVPVSHAQAVYNAIKHPQSAVVEMQNAGHDLVATHARQVQDVITQFVKEQSTYRIYPLQMLPVNVSKRRQLQNRVYASVGLVSLAALLFSWLAKGSPKTNK